MMNLGDLARMQFLWKGTQEEFTTYDNNLFLQKFVLCEKKRNDRIISFLFFYIFVAIRCGETCC